MSECECTECFYLKTHRKVACSRTAYHCGHPNQASIVEHFKIHRIQKMPGFLGFGTAAFPLKRTPKWCPRKNIASKEVPPDA